MTNVSANFMFPGMYNLNRPGQYQASTSQPFSNGSIGNPMQNMMQGMGMLFAGMDMIDNGQMDGSLFQMLGGGQPQQAQYPQGNLTSPYQQQMMPQPGMMPSAQGNSPYGNQQNAMPFGNNPMMGMLMQMMQMFMSSMMDLMDDGQMNGSTQNLMNQQQSPFSGMQGMNYNPATPMAGRSNNGSFANAWAGPNGAFASAGTGSPWNNWNNANNGNYNTGGQNYGNYNPGRTNNGYQTNPSTSNITSGNNLNNVPGNATRDSVYNNHDAHFRNTKLDLTASQQRDLQKFQKNYAQNKGRYQSVSDKTGVPPELIAALHWRESSGNFNTYLHQGDPLGKPAKHVPKNIPVFHNWEDAAVHALGMKAGNRNKYGLSSNSKDIPGMLAYAERYNGLGYHSKGVASPYVYSGTDQYQSGKYVADHVYNPNYKDTQLGVLAMIMSVS